MPDGCYNCRFKHYSPPTGLTLCTITGNILAEFQKPLQFIGRADTCPLFKIPSHGRLIDADAFCEKVLEIVERQKYDDFYAKRLSVGEILREVVRELRGKGFDGFDNAPTIIEAEGDKND